MIEPYFEDQDYQRYKAQFDGAWDGYKQPLSEEDTPEELLEEDEIDAYEAAFLRGYRR